MAVLLPVGQLLLLLLLPIKNRLAAELAGVFIKKDVSKLSSLTEAAFRYGALCDEPLLLLLLQLQDLFQAGFRLILIKPPDLVSRWLGYIQQHVFDPLGHG